MSPEEQFAKKVLENDSSSLLIFVKNEVERVLKEKNEKELRAKKDEELEEYIRNKNPWSLL